MTINNHGDVVLFPITDTKPPKDAESALLHVLESSEATGNRHEVYSDTEPILKWVKDDIVYLYCKTQYYIRHIGGDGEHGIQEVEAGTRQIKKEMEHDPWTNELRRVID